MSDRFAVFIDSSFLRSAGAKRLGMRPSTSEIDPDAAVAYFGAAPQGNGQMLRIYWYDGQFPSTHPASAEQRKYLDEVGLTPAITLRLGVIKSVMPPWLRVLRNRLEREGVAASIDIRPLDVQKGVDTLLALDLVRLAQKRAYATALVVAGDRDFVEAVKAAQDEGRLVTLAFPDGAGVDPELLRSADDVQVIDEPSLRRLIRARPEESEVAERPDSVTGGERVNVLCPTEDCQTTLRVHLGAGVGESAVPTCPNCGRRFHVHRSGDASYFTREWGYTTAGSSVSLEAHRMRRLTGKSPTPAAQVAEDKV